MNTATHTTVWRNLFRWIVFSVPLGGVVLTLSAGWKDPWMWAYVGALSACSLYAVTSITPDLAHERMHPPTRGADAPALLAIRIFGFAHLVVGAIDAGRWHLTPGVPPLMRGPALAAMIAAFLLIFRAMRENRFFSAVVRLQEDRGHRVVESGPYAFVRHPGYAGMIAGVPASGLALGSWIGFAIAVAYSALILRRVSFEDRFLQQQLAGYTQYAARVPSRVLPGVW
jgi:protein-S-isoprenylcysteine O-methyltransferase Ste14